MLRSIVSICKDALDVLRALWGAFWGFYFFLMGTYRGPEEITACEAVQYIAYESKWGQKRVRQQQVEIEASGALEQAAENGKIVIKGRLADDWEVKPINRDYWVTASIITYGCMEPTGGRTTKKRDRYGDDDLALLNIPIYVDLRVARQDVEELWPRPFWVQRNPHAYHRERMKKEVEGSDIESSER